MTKAKSFTKDQILKLLRENDVAVARALVVLKNNQTDSEQSAEAVLVHNGKGFRPCHGRIGTNMAKFYEERGFLTDKQIAYWRKADRSGQMRIGMYTRQLIEAAEAKKELKELTQ